MELNAGQARARATGETVDPTLEFWKKMAYKMLTNKLNDDGVARGTPVRPQRWESTEHIIGSMQNMREFGT
jgi:hypothetical protein